MKTGLWKGRLKVKIYETKEDGKTVFLVEFANGNSITVSDETDITYN